MRLGLCVLILCFGTFVSARECSICSLFGDHLDYFPGYSEDHETPTRRHFETNRRERESSSEDLGEALEQAGMVTDVAQTLFGRLLGIVGDRIGKVSSSPGRFESVVDVRDGSHQKGTSMSKSIFNLFDTIGSIPRAMHTDRLDGPHICTREVNTILPPTNGSYKSMNKCERYQDAYKCIDRRETPEKSHLSERIQECCAGFATDNIVLNGCGKAENVTTWNDLQENFGVASDFGNFDTKSTAILWEGAQKGFVLKGLQYDYEWSENGVVETEENQTLFVSRTRTNETLTTHLNCVPLVRANIRVVKGLVHIGARPIKGAAKDIIQLLEDDKRFSTFLSLISNETRDSLQSSKMDWTVLPFSDETFKSLPKSLQRQIHMKTGCVAGIERSHIFPKSRCSHQFQTSPMIALTGQRHFVYKAIRNGELLLRVGNARVTEMDLVAEHGVIHVVDDVLIREELISWEDNLSKYNSEMAAMLHPLLKDNNQSLTIFVPPNNSTEITSEVSLNSVVEGAVLHTTSLPETITTMAGSTMFAGDFPSHSPFSMRISTGHPSSSNVFQVGCSRIIGKSVHSCNSVLHFVDKALPVVKHDVRGYIRSRSDLSKFWKLWKMAFPSDEPSSVFTVFAPLDDAFSVNGFKKIINNLVEVKRFVGSHIVDRPLCEHDLRHNKDEIRVEIIQNRNGGNIRASNENEDIYIEGARVEESIVAENGVIHVLDSVIQKQEHRMHPSSSMRRITNILDILH